MLVSDNFFQTVQRLPGFSQYITLSIVLPSESNLDKYSRK